LQVTNYKRLTCCSEWGRCNEIHSQLQNYWGRDGCCILRMCSTRYTNKPLGG